MSFKKIAATLILASLLAGCDSVESRVNQKFPPVSADQHRVAAISTALKTLDGPMYPNLALNVRLMDATAILNESEFRTKFGIKSIKLRGDQQILFADLSIQKQLSKNDFPLADDKTKALIQTLKPDVAGELSVGLGVTSAVVNGPVNNLKINLKLLPLFRSIHVKKASFAEKVDLAAATDLLASLMNVYADNISGELSRRDFTQISLPALPLNTIDPSKSITFEGNGTSGKITLTAKPIESPVYMRSIVWLIDEENMSAAAELVPVEAAAVQQPAGTFSNVSFSSLREAYSKAIKQKLGLSSPATTNYLAVTKSMIASIANSAVRQAQPCIDAAATLAPQEFSKKIEIPDETSIDCTPTRECSPTRDCTPTQNCEQTRACELSHDDRNCRTCAWTQCPSLRKPFNQCEQCVNNPVCEAAKAAQNAGYKIAKDTCEAEKVTAKATCEVDKKAKSVDCERLKSQEKAQCEIEKTGQKALCETGKEALKRISRLGNVANDDGKISGSANVGVCIKNFDLSSSLNTLDMSFAMVGEGAADLDIKYVPLDIAGYLVCQFPWTEGKHVTIALPSTVTKVDSKLAFVPSAGGIELKADIQTSSLPVQMRPGPRDIILKSFNMRLACLPINGLLHPLDLDVSNLIPVLNGDFTMPGPRRSLNLTLTPPQLHVVGSPLILRGLYGVNVEALFVEGSLGPPK